ncbi:hypothetical protein ACEQ8H_008804 [Pleosporales sp. CAS-2024a]
MNNEFRPHVHSDAWGPLISPNYVEERVTYLDIAIASVVWALTLLNVGIAIWQATKQTRASKSPVRSTYVWMIWLELIISFVMGLECYLHLLKYISSSFSFYFTILLWWCIQVQLLLQIIINRIRVIVPDRRRSRNIMIGTAVFVTTINISVFNIWIPARLQISDRYHIINEYWDRIEKVLYLIVDGALNWYFLKIVKANLIRNGLTKYDKLVKFNQRIVIISLLMDVMIIGAMSIPNSFVYIQFHPLAYLVKLNIEMTMANLIKRIAISTFRRNGQKSIADEFKSSTNLSKTGRQTGTDAATRHTSIHELSSIVSCHADGKADHDHVQSFHFPGNQIKATHSITITSEPNSWGRREAETETKVTGPYIMEQRSVPDIILEEAVTPSRKSTDSSVKSVDAEKRALEDSDDEIALVDQGRRWDDRGL